MDQPLVSCIVPVFNGERYLAEALDSILAQQYEPLEIIVADDGSTDGTAAIARSYGDRVRVIRQPNAGAPAARNLGLQAARGELIAFLDSDDLWHREKLARQTARFAARPELEVSVTHVQSFWIPELQDEAERFRDHPLSQPQPGYVTITMLARRAVFERVGGFNTGLSVGDPMEWFVRAAEHGTIMDLLPDTLAYRRLHQRNLSWESGGARRMTTAMQEAVLRVVKESLDRRRGDGAVVQRYDFPDAVRGAASGTGRRDRNETSGNEER
jgi:glycosyltransferase involved in cell wall biosynthesis